MEEHLLGPVLQAPPRAPPQMHGRENGSFQGGKLAHRQKNKTSEQPRQGNKLGYRFFQIPAEAEAGFKTRLTERTK